MTQKTHENIPYTFTPELILRTPAYPFGSEPSEELIDKLLHDSFFLEALFFASPVLYKECIKLKNNLIPSDKEVQKLKLSIVKYYQRMSSRCTPFGLFSACSLVNWQEDPGKIVLSNEVNRHTRLDMHYLCALGQKIASLPGLKKKLLYFTNNSIYPVGDELRYIEYQIEHARRSHQVSAVGNTEYLQTILQKATNGITLQEAENMLLQENIASEEAHHFIDELVKSQILVSELEPTVTGKEFIHQLINTLEKYSHEVDQIATVLDTLYQVRNKLRQLDEGSNNNIEVLDQIKTLLLMLEIEYDENKLFQVDSFKTVRSGSVNKGLQAEIYSAFELLNKLNAEGPDKDLKTFITRFRERYEDTTIPLLEAMDTESGIGYPENIDKAISPLTEGLVLPSVDEQENHQFQKNSLQQLLFNKILDATRKDSYTIQLTSDDFPDQKANWDDLPPSLSVMFRVIDPKEGKIIIDSMSGPSAANLLGRFAHGHTGIADLVTGITSKEQELNPGILFAEIAHLPESRTGNILQRPVLRTYEIPYLAKSAVGPEKQIHPGDLWITVSNDRIKLFSGKTKTEIIPRLSTAHNFRNKALPVYRFLCDLQSQSLRNSFGFYWGAMTSQFKFFPRVEYGNIILHEARWQLNKVDLGNFVSAIENDQPAIIESFVQHWNLPRCFTLVDSDNELLVNSNNQLSLLAFAKTIKNRSTVTLKEFIPGQATQINCDHDGVLVNQFIATLLKTENVYTPGAQPQAVSPRKQKRKFEPGSEWLYFKLYCGAQSAEKLLTGIVKPLTDKWMRDNLIQKWFFIRYNDPSFHLRLRLHLINNNNTGSIMNELAEKIMEAGLSEFIWKTQVDTYLREVERYGPGSIELSEELFYHDSLNKLRFMELAEEHEREIIRWQWGLAMADALLNAFELTLQRKQSFLHRVKESFKKEFNTDKTLLSQINKKYESNKTIIRSIISKLNCDLNDSTALIIAEANKFLENNKFLVSKIRNAIPYDEDLSSPEKLIASYLHMMFNRLFPSEARLQEYILYEFLNRYYLSVLKQTGSSMADHPSLHKV